MIIQIGRCRRGVVFLSVARFNGGRPSNSSSSSFGGELLLHLPTWRYANDCGKRFCALQRLDVNKKEKLVHWKVFGWRERCSHVALSAAINSPFLLNLSPPFSLARSVGRACRKVVIISHTIIIFDRSSSHDKVSPTDDSPRAEDYIFRLEFGFFFSGFWLGEELHLSRVIDGRRKVRAVNWTLAKQTRKYFYFPVYL